MTVLNLLFFLVSTLGGLLPSSDPTADTPTHTCTAVQVPDSLSGKWEGALGAPPNAVALGLAFQRDGAAWSGTFAVPVEGIRDLPLHSVERAGDEVVAHLTPQRLFRGRLMGDSLSGHLVMNDRGGLETEVVLHREGSRGWERLQVDLAQWDEERMSAPAPGLVEDERGDAWARAEGYLGQYLVIYPDSGLVGVRMIEAHDGYMEARDGFAVFQHLLRELR